MTREEAELIAREIRARCLHSSWDELVSFWEAVVGDIKGAYQAAVQCGESLNLVSSKDCKEMEKYMKDRLAEALAQLAGKGKVDQWEAEAKAEGDA